MVAEAAGHFKAGLAFVFLSKQINKGNRVNIRNSKHWHNLCNVESSLFYINQTDLNVCVCVYVAVKNKT